MHMVCECRLNEFPLYQHPQAKSIRARRQSTSRPLSIPRGNLDFCSNRDQITHIDNWVQEDRAMPQVTTTISQIEDSTASRTRIRGHELVTDRPTEKGGGNQGPMGGELFVASLGGCFMSNLIAAFQAREIEAKGLSVTISGSLEGTPPRFQKMAMAVKGHGIERDQMEKMVLVAERGCIVANTLKQFMDVEISIA
jgi:putative redox protein